MKKILKNKKGFTLVELLAVIVVLAIIMVIATQQVSKTISNSRSNAFVSSYQMIVKQVKTFIASSETVDCATANACQTKYELSADYELVVTDNLSGTVTITLEPLSTGKFKSLDLGKYGNYHDSGVCKPDRIGSGATSCAAQKIIGIVNY